MTYVFDAMGTQLKAGDIVRTQSQLTAIIVEIGTQATRGVWCAVKATGTLDRPVVMWWEQSTDLTYVESDA